MVATVDSSFASPLADAAYAGSLTADAGLVSRLYNGMNGLSVCMSLLLVLVAYDQCKWGIE